MPRMFTSVKWTKQLFKLNWKSLESCNGLIVHADALFEGETKTKRNERRESSLIHFMLCFFQMCPPVEPTTWPTTTWKITSRTKLVSVRCGPSSLPAVWLASTIGQLQCRPMCSRADCRQHQKARTKMACATCLENWCKKRDRRHCIVALLRLCCERSPPTRPALSALSFVWDFWIGQHPTCRYANAIAIAIEEEEKKLLGNRLSIHVT